MLRRSNSPPRVTGRLHGLCMVAFAHRTESPMMRYVPMNVEVASTVRRDF
jgi:hypothetical protein